MITLLAIALSQIQSKGPQGDALVTLALANLRQGTSLFLQMSGQVEMGVKPLIKTEPIECDAYWQESGGKRSASVQAEVLEYRNKTLVTRLAADGESVWNYNLIAHEYRSTNYRGYGPVPRGYVDSALSLLREDASHVGAHTTRLLEQTFGGAAPTFQTWISGATVKTVPDPLISNITDVIYSLGTPLRRQATFKIVAGENNTYKLSSIEYEDHATSEGRPRTVTWTLTPSPVIASSANFKPYPGQQVADWKVVAAGD